MMATVKVDLLALESAIQQWRDLATKNDWAQTHPGFTVWVTADGTVTDSVAVQSGQDTLYIVVDDGGEK
jgi:hypothetical protein